MFPNSGGHSFVSFVVVFVFRAGVPCSSAVIAQLLLADTGVSARIFSGSFGVGQNNRWLSGARVPTWRSWPMR